MATYDLFEFTSPALPVGELVPDATYNQMVYELPRTFEFLSPDPPFLQARLFDGTQYYPQYTEGQEFDMDGSNESGGDFFEICGFNTYTDYYEDIVYLNGNGRYTLQTRKVMRQVLVGEDDEFQGGYEAAEEVLLEINTETGSNPIQSRVVRDSQFKVWGSVGTNDPPNFRQIGGGTYTNEVTLDTHRKVAERYHEDLIGLEDEFFYGLVLEPSVHTSGTKDGRNSRLWAGLAYINPADIAAHEGEENYTVGNRVRFVFKYRMSRPVVYEDDGGEPSGVVGNACYGRGVGGILIDGLITEKLWKDAYGTYDQAPEALDSIAWAPSTFYASPDLRHYGIISKGRLMSNDGGTYQLKLMNVDEVNIATLEFGPTTPLEYDFPLTDDSDEAFAQLESLSEWKGGEWVEIESPATVIAGLPQPGIRVVHWLKRRAGTRWGHSPNTPQDPAPEHPEEENLYLRKIFYKDASP